MPQTSMAAGPPAAPSEVGEWDPQFDLLNVAIHAHLLPTGKVLYWGRRSQPGNTTFATLNEHFCSTFLWDPVTRHDTPTAQRPHLDGNQSVNLFCSGHSFLPDGRLLVVGGHLFDSEGVNQACVYDPELDTWTPLPHMNGGRWYPSALTLPDGGVLSISGSFADGRPQPPPDNAIAPPRDTNFPTNINPEIWRSENWVPTENFKTLSLYPRLHLEPTLGRVFMAGPQGDSSFLDVGATTWTPGPSRVGALREYAPSVMYQSGKILFIGGGQDEHTQLPTNLVEAIDLTSPAPQWNAIMPMNFARRQHNATVLPDGTVLVTGGTQGLPGNPHWEGFNNLRPGAPVHQAELWDPKTGRWTLMAAESVDRCYHSIALLLPDARVLSAGGGEYDPKDPTRLQQPNPPVDSHQDAQLFNPPYLFKGPRPTISNPPTEIFYEEAFNVNVGAADVIKNVSWIRLGSVTHSCNQNQSCIFLKFGQAGSNLTVTAPADSTIAPPGHYMLFVLNELGVPSEAPIIRITAPAENVVRVQRTSVAAPRPVDIMKLNRRIASDEGRPHVAVGVTPSCPYGLGACWGGALGGLQQLDNVKIVRPVPNTTDSLAFLYLREDRLPDLDAWREQFARIVNGTYIMRGIEVTISGAVTQTPAGLTLADAATGSELVLEPLQAADTIQWDMRTRASRPVSTLEASAFARLTAALAGRPTGVTIQVTGPLVKSGEDFSLQVREFEVARRGLVRQAKRLVTATMAWLSRISCFA